MSTIDPKFIELEQRVRGFERYDKLFNMGKSLAYSTFFLSYVVDFVSRLLLGTGLGSTGIVVFWSIGLAASFALIILSSRKLRKYRLNDVQWTFFYTNSITKNLEKCKGESNQEMRKEYRKRAVKRANNFLAYMKKNWKTGGFTLIRNQFQKPLSELKKNFQFRVIPFLKEQSVEELEKVEQIMRTLSFDYKSLDGIKNVNKQMNDILPNREPSKVGFRKGIVSYFAAHRLRKHVVAGLICFLGVGLFFYTFAIVWEFEKNIVLSGSILAFLSLLGLYFSRQPKQQN